MSVTGLCQICQAARAQYRCESCGTLVCNEHFEPGMALCVQCADTGGGRQI